MCLFHKNYTGFEKSKPAPPPPIRCINHLCAMESRITATRMFVPWPIKADNVHWCATCVYMYSVVLYNSYHLNVVCTMVVITTGCQILYIIIKSGSQLYSTQYMRLCVFTLRISLVTILNRCVLFLVPSSNRKYESLPILGKGMKQLHALYILLNPIMYSFDIIA